MQTEQRDEFRVSLLYQKLLECWNKHNAREFASLFAVNGNTIGFDGSQMNGRQQIADETAQIFASHQVSSYVGIIKEVRALCPDVFVVRAVAGMFPQGGNAINPAVNAIQTLMVIKEGEKFSIAVFQNTPAAFHGRQQLNNELTHELQQALDTQRGAGSHDV